MNPYLVVADKALSHCHRLWGVLGLTPSGRARVGAQLAVPPTASRWDGLL
jgi:phage terminase small subunit